MRLEVHLLSHDHEEFLPWALRYYLSIAHRIVVHDGGPKGTNRPARDDSWVQYRPWDTAGQLNDELAMRLKNTCWAGSTADWVACVDADEVLHFPMGAAKTLEAYTRMGAAVIRPSGFEMFCDVWPDLNAVHSSTQITDLVKHGAPADKWYAKPILFNPRLVADSGFGIGAHESNPVLKDGRRLKVDANWPKANPPTYLLHYHQVGPIERIARRYDETRARLSAINEDRKWGNFQPGLVHAQEKRDQILPHLRQVVE